MNEDLNNKLLNESLQRCMENEKFLTIFYDRFLHSSPEIRAKFTDTNLTHQIDMMRNSLYGIISVSEANWQSDQMLTDIAQKHQNLDIKPEHYTLWETSLLSTVAQCDPEYNEEIREAWKHILRRGVEFMMSF